MLFCTYFISFYKFNNIIVLINNNFPNIFIVTYICMYIFFNEEKYFEDEKN